MCPRRGRRANDTLFQAPKLCQAGSQRAARGCACGSSRIPNGPWLPGQSSAAAPGVSTKPYANTAEICRFTVDRSPATARRAVFGAPSAHSRVARPLKPGEWPCWIAGDAPRPGTLQDSQTLESTYITVRYSPCSGVWGRSSLTSQTTPIPSMCLFSRVRTKLRTSAIETVRSQGYQMVRG